MLTQAPTRAERQAAERYERNLAALKVRQPRLVGWLEDQFVEQEWLFARDGTLSGRDTAGQWISGCSVPNRLSQIVLKNLEIRGSVACFLAPGHATDIDFALARLTDAQAILTILPSYNELATMLHCIDFSAAIRVGRLYLVGGAAWDVELEKLFEEHSSLATPTSFIRLPATDESIITPLLSRAQAIINAAADRRAASIAGLREAYVAPRSNKLCIVAPSRFRLWNDFGSAMQSLGQTPGGMNLALFDTDDPANAGPETLVAAACQADGLLTVNTARTDLPGVIPNNLPWISWITGARLPSAALAQEQDRLLLSHISLRPAAERAGWATEQIAVADWPAQMAPPLKGNALALICDTSPLDTPADLDGYSSHKVLWETIREELLANPFDLRQVDSYLRTHLDLAGIVDSAFSHGRFVDQLIVPAYAQGLARTLLRSNVSVQFWGSGWDEIEPFSAASRGRIDSRENLRDAIAGAIALVHPLVARAGHPILRCGRPVIAATDAGGFLRLARQALNGRLIQLADPAPQLSAALLEKLLVSITN